MAYRHFIFSVKRSCFIGIGNAVPLIAVNALYPVVAVKNTGKGRVSKQRRFEELGKMKILCMTLGEQGAAQQEQRQYLTNRVWIFHLWDFYLIRVTFPWYGIKVL